MSKIKVKIDKVLVMNRELTTTRKYQHLIVGNLFSTIHISSNFMSSLSNLGEVLEIFYMKNLETKSDSFVRCMSSLKKLKELTLNKVKFIESETGFKDEQFNPRLLRSLVIQNCKSSSVIRALFILKIQSVVIKVSHDCDTDNLPKFLCLQRFLGSLIITNVSQSNIEILMKQLIFLEVHYDGLKRIVIDKLVADNSMSYLSVPRNTQSKLHLNLSSFLTTHASTIRELHMENLMDFKILQAIANIMELETLTFRWMSPMMKSNILALEPNLFLKTLYAESAFELNELSGIFPSVENLKIKFQETQTMDVLTYFKNIKNLFLEKSSRFGDTNLEIPSLRIVCFNFEDLNELRKFFESNCETIDVLIIKKFKVLNSEDILEFLSKFNNIFLTDDCDLEALSRIDNVDKYSDRILLEVESSVYEKARENLGGNSEITEMLKVVSDKSLKRFFDFERIFDIVES